MKISFITVKNFRKLKAVKIDLSEDKTLFVGANNSGKTSAMDALRKFLVRTTVNSFVYNDLTATNRKAINAIGVEWVKDDAKKPENVLDWSDIIPSMDIWLKVEDNEFHYVAHIIPTLNWAGGKLGIRLSFLPKKIEKLFIDYKDAYAKSRETEGKDKTKKVKLYPQSLCEFIEKNLSKYFEIKAFILDPAKIDDEQATDFDYACQSNNPLEGLIKIDMISAQRGLTDADSASDAIGLSPQLRLYYDKHLDIEKQTAPEDLETFSALQSAHETFNGTLATKFKESFAELETLGFPSLTDPKITIESKFREKTAFEHESAVQYALTDDDATLRLPEKYNGLGYQNLISIAFKLMSFRDDRIHKGKAKSEDGADKIAPLHLVLLEEPEAHLHVQVQQVLIKKAYEILTRSKILTENGFNTQLVVSTHSSHIAREVPFRNIRYFKRIFSASQKAGTAIEVVNLTDIFGADVDTEKFVQRYIRVTHCDLFFADAVIFVEGTSETVLLPHFIEKDYPILDSKYITVLPVGGSHSHKFKPLTDKLGLPVLVITDIDPIDITNHRKHVQPKRNCQNIETGNSSLSCWGITDKKLDSLLNLTAFQKEVANGQVRIAYQTPVELSCGKISGEALAATFEDALTYANLKELETVSIAEGITAYIKLAMQKQSIDEFCSDVYIAIREKSNKVSFALDLIYKLEKVEVPAYIKEGLEWLQSKLQKKEAVSTEGERK